MGNNCSSKIFKNPRKNIHCRVRFRAVGKNSGAVHEHKHGTFSECFLENFTKVFRTV